MGRGRSPSIRFSFSKVIIAIFAAFLPVDIHAEASSGLHTPVSVVFIAGLEGTGHHAWKQVLREWCYRSPSRGLCCDVDWELKKSLLKATRLMQKDFQPHLGCKKVHSDVNADCGFLNETTTSTELKSKLKIVSDKLMKVAKNTQVECSSRNTCDQRHFIFLNVHTNGTMWSYPDSRGEGGHGWNPEARAIQSICQMSGLELKIIWLHRNGPHLIRSNVVHRRFHRQKYAAHTWGEVTFKRKSVKWFGHNDTLALDFYMESLTRSLCLLHRQMRAAYECSQRRDLAFGCADVMLVDYDQLICHPKELSSQIAIFLGVSKPESFVHSLESTVRCSRSSAKDDTSISELQEHAFQNSMVQDFLKMSTLAVSDSVVWSKHRLERVGLSDQCHG